jgi:hypothetical protein
MSAHREPLPDVEVRDVLATLRDSGLVTDRAELNRAWRVLTGHPRLGPCALCGVQHQRYGDQGQPLCPDCRTQPDNRKDTP